MGKRRSGTKFSKKMEEKTERPTWGECKIVNHDLTGNTSSTEERTREHTQKHWGRGAGNVHTILNRQREDAPAKSKVKLAGGEI